MVSTRAEAVAPAVVRHDGRGLCTNCHRYLARRDELADYARTTRSLDDTIADFHVLLGRGLDYSQIATQLGMKPASLQRQLERARARETRTNTCVRSTCEEHVL